MKTTYQLKQIAKLPCVIGVIFLSAAAVFTAQGATILARFSFGIAVFAAISTIIATSIYFVLIVSKQKSHTPNN